jgi:hypothetical protein
MSSYQPEHNNSHLQPAAPQNLILPAGQRRTPTTLYELTQGEDRTMPWFGPKLLRMECFPALKTLADVEQFVIAQKDQIPFTTSLSAMSSLRDVGILITRCEYDQATLALDRFSESQKLLPPGSRSEALLALLRAQVASLAKQVPLSTCVELSLQAEGLLKQLTLNTPSASLFQAQALSARQSVSLDSINHTTKVECFAKAVETFSALADPEKLSVLAEINNLTVALFEYFPLSLREERQKILHNIHAATSSNELYLTASVPHRFQLDLNIVMMACYSPSFHLTLSGNEAQLHKQLEALGQQIVESSQSILGNETPAHQPLFRDIQRVAKLCRDNELFELAHTIADCLYYRMDLNRLQHRDILLYGAAVMLTSRPYIHERNNKLLSSKELRDSIRRDFKADSDALDQIELLYGDLLLLSDLEMYDRQHIQLQQIVTEDIISRKGVKDSVRLRAIQLLEELLEYQ